MFLFQSRIRGLTGSELLIGKKIPGGNMNPEKIWKEIFRENIDG